MKALSILQPWAWLIVHGYKDIENRSWHTQFRGRFLVHTGKTYSRALHEEYAGDFFEDGITLPRFEAMPLGAIVGEAELTDCVQNHASRWKMPGSWGFVLANAKALTRPTPYRGERGFFEISHTTSVLDLLAGDSPG